jgi:protein gp37
MAQSSIEWTGKVWNPTTGCNKVSQGCKNCYAEKMHKRLKGMGQDKYRRNFLDGAFPHEESLLYPLTIKKPTTFFVNSMSDLFHDMIPDSYIAKVFAVMALCPQHTFQVLTKRSLRMNILINKDVFFDYMHEAADEIEGNNPYLLYTLEKHDIEGEKMAFPSNNLLPHLKAAKWYSGTFHNGDDTEHEFYYEGQYPLPNVWLGVSVENQETAEERIPHLVETPAAIRFLSMEPMLEAIDLSKVLPVNLLPESPELDWIIVGGESGHKRRPFNADWARTIKEYCWSHNIAFFMKQIDKKIQIPQDLMIREYPRTFNKI